MRKPSEKKIFEAKISSKGQMVIPKPLRGEYNLRQGSKVKIIATRDGLLIKPRVEGPWIGLRGIMREDWKDKDLDQVIEEAKRSLFKSVETGC